MLDRNSGAGEAVTHIAHSLYRFPGAVALGFPALQQAVVETYESGIRFSDESAA